MEETRAPGRDPATFGKSVRRRVASVRREHGLPSYRALAMCAEDWLPSSQQTQTQIWAVSRLTCERQNLKT